MRPIDADALRKAVNDFFDNSFEGIVSNDLIKYAEAVDDYIDNAPTVDTTFREVVAYECGQKSVEERRTREWIPVNDRLPDLFEVVLVTDECGNVFEYERRPLNDDENVCDEWCFLGRNIVAWMSLPEPYKRGEA